MYFLACASGGQELNCTVAAGASYLLSNVTAAVPAPQDVRKSPFRRSEHNMMADLQNTVTGLTAELSAKDTTIRALEVSVQCLTTTYVTPACYH